jgi:hypothetical protein
MRTQHGVSEKQILWCTVTMIQNCQIQYLMTIHFKGILIHIWKVAQMRFTRVCHAGRGVPEMHWQASKHADYKISLYVNSDCYYTCEL